MPTIDAFYATGQERWDCASHVEFWSAGGVPHTNRYGRYSQVIQPNGGANGLRGDPAEHGQNANYGGFYSGVSWWIIDDTGLVPALPIGFFHDEAGSTEGSGHYLMALYFKPNITRGSTVSDARLHLFLAAANMAQIHFRLRIFAVAEDSAHPPRLNSGVLRNTYNNVWSIQPQAHRFGTENSWEDDGEHTVAATQWQFSHPVFGNNDLPGPHVINGEWVTPDISPVINEIVGRPGWVPGNNMCIVVTGDGASWGVSGPVDSSTGTRLHFRSVIGTPSQYVPKLVWT